MSYRYVYVLSIFSDHILYMLYRQEIIESLLDSFLYDRVFLFCLVFLSKELEKKILETGGRKNLFGKKANNVSVRVALKK
jgi:hypothetical protein